MLIKALLLAVWAAICRLDTYGPQFQISRPLIAGSITGLLLGDFTQGMIIAASLELMWLGVTSIGAYVPPDIVSGTILGTAFGIISGKGAVAGIAIAVPVSLICQQLSILVRTITISMSHMADKAAEEGNFDKVDKYHLLGGAIFALGIAIPVFLAVYFGADYVQKLFNVLPKVIMDGLNIAGGIMPALGFGMLLSLMLNKKIWIFFLLGFVANAYGKIPTIGIAIIGVIAAFLYDMITTNKKTISTPTQGGIDL